ncbi:hypothetical protein N7451_009510 [Penicillium sp. IBT 35674x]|nr:hypothetical protein N7451_009510 [Penicillium sp. IBT 35674x]
MQTSIALWLSQPPALILPTGNRGISRKSLHHISAAYALVTLVNTKISGPFSISDSAIAAMVSLAIYQQIHHQPETGLVNVHGLRRLIELRSRITKLMQENRFLALETIEVDLAIQNKTPTLFRRDAVPVHLILCDPVMPPDVSNIFSFSRLLNEVERMQALRLNPLDYTDNPPFASLSPGSVYQT